MVVSSKRMPQAVCRALRVSCCMSRVQSTLRRAFAVRAARIVTTSLLVRVNVTITASRINVEAIEPFRTLFVSFDLSLIRYISFFFSFCTMKRKIISGKDTSKRALNYKPTKCIVRSIVEITRVASLAPWNRKQTTYEIL